MKALCSIYIGICGVYSEILRNTCFYGKFYSCAHLVSCHLTVALSDRNEKNIKGPLIPGQIRILDLIISNGYAVIPWQHKILHMSIVASVQQFRGMYITPPTHHVLDKTMEFGCLPECRGHLRFEMMLQYVQIVPNKTGILEVFLLNRTT